MAKYFGVITGRDYIDINGTRIPFWDLLDVQPRGWLTSVANIRHDIPISDVSIYDCGAWTYRDNDTPVLKNQEVTPLGAYEQYKKYCRPYDMLIAPDHMLIDIYDNLEDRREFNKRSMREFINIVEPQFSPMAVIHGMDIHEKEDNAKFALGLGYKHICIGGLAGQARKRDWCVEQVEHIMKVVPDGVWVHVLGLSSPFYASQWKRLGVSSFDGSSYFKKAFNGDFVTFAGNELGKKKAQRISAENECNCAACVVAKDNGFNTMLYGNSVNNIGRAAHNLNMLIKKYVDMGVM